MYNNELQNDSLILPYCSPDIYVSSTGVVTDASANVIQLDTNEHTEFGCVLNWFDGVKWYPLSLIKMVAFRPLRLSVHFWSKLSVMYKDGNVQNTALENLVWKYPKQLEVKNHPGYYYVPCFSRYAISAEGLVLDLNTGMPVKLLDSKGYVRLFLKDDWGSWRSRSQHRLLSYVFFDYPANFDIMHVNHKNGIKDDNRLDNLEIVTAQENCQHAYDTQLHTGVKRVKATHADTGETIEFSSMTACCINFQIGRNVLSSTHGKWQFELIERDGRPVINYPKKIVSRDVLTGIVATYRTLRECSRKLGISVMTINNYLKTAQSTVLAGQYQLRLADDQVTWTELPENEVLENYSTFRKAVIVRDVRANKVTRFESVAQCSQALGITSDAVLWRLTRQNQPVFADGLQYRYAFDSSDWRDVKDVDLEIAQSAAENAVLVRYLKTGQVQEFPSQNVAALALGVCDATMHNWLRHKQGMRTLPGLIQVKFKLDDVAWREVSSPEEDLTENYGIKRRVEVKEVATGNVTTFDSLKDCADAHDCGITTIAYRVSTNGQRVFKDRQMYRYHGEIKPWLQ